MSVNIELYDDLDAVARDAAGALDRSSRTNIYERLDWYRLIAAYCPPPGTLLVARASSGDKAAWLFLSVQDRQATAFAAWYSLRVGIAGNRQDDVMTAIARTLRNRGLASIELAPVEEAEPLAAALRAAGWVVRVDPKTANWRIDTGGMNFADYWASRPGKLRSTFKRRAKAANLDIEIHDRFDPDAWAAYEAVYRASWKPEEGSFPFLRALAEQEGAAGALRLGIARLQGEPVAAQLWLVENGEATIHKLAYAESAKSLSPGTILGEAMFRHALDVDRVKTIDYGTGDEAYKAEWMAERRTLWRVAAYNPRTIRGLFGAVRARVAKLAGRGRNG
ncbi:MAG: GNAT family N-acetyltransferase [Sphingomonas sp.]